ncbi:glycosyltransferase family 2 protein [Streptomyces sp. 35G-GA-8]|uniref:glycosyltransferase family 2 protein n=1 Tax=Streptomyces sp. 35G-GA-8 TaxID=2939434 RepID=UPI00201FB05F|nr:glycosyltransferase family 2 protein [Streptomyces sp. 35G-GA-8]MCL7379292.1 glycosyltransferase family 2 protein [Streptomyces sp. 35G-GA-8]
MSAVPRPESSGEDPLIIPSRIMASRPRPVSERPYRPVSSHLAIAPPVSVVIPAMNEAENLPYVFRSLPDWIHEVVLVDGNSTDDTVRVARALRPDVKVVEQRGTGKGDALISGFAACTGDIIVMVDADGSADGQEIVSYVSALVSGADFAKGSRFANGGGTDDMTPIRKLGNRVLCAVVNAKFGARYTDLCYGYNAFWRRCLDEITLDCTGFEVETLMNIRVVKAGLRVQEIPSHEYDRIHGVSNLRAVRDGFRVLRVILRERGIPRSVRAVRRRPAGLRFTIPAVPVVPVAPTMPGGEVL